MKTLTVAKHPAFVITDDSVGKWVVPHVCTSVAPELELIRVRTNLKADAEAQLVVEG